MVKKKKSSSLIEEPDKSLVARAIDWANENAPGNPATNMARFIGKFNYDTEKSSLSKKKDGCARNKKIIKGVTGSWYDHPGSADVLGIDVPSVKVNEHTRINKKTGALIRVKTYYRSSKKFPDTCGK